MRNSSRFLLNSISVIILASSAQAQGNRAPKINLGQLPVTCVEETAPSFMEDGLSGKDYACHGMIEDTLERTKGVLNEKDEEFSSDWGLLMAAKDAKSKVASIYESADRNDMPPQVLVGALIQESFMGDLGISSDWGNWSCGIGQLNALEWCHWAESETLESKLRMHWPVKEIAAFKAENPETDVCSGYFLRAKHVKPFFDVGMARFNAKGPHLDFQGKPMNILLSKKDVFEPNPISYDEAALQLVAISKEKISCSHRNRFNEECLKISPSKNEPRANQLRYLIAKSFAENCSDHRMAIPAKAFTLRSIHDELPADVKAAQHYTGNEAYGRKCMQAPKSHAYPLSLGWLLSDIVYNAGDEILPGLYEYWKKHKLNPEDVGPTELAASIEYTLNQKKYQKHLTLNGRCEAYRHIRDMIHNITLTNNVILGEAPNLPPECAGNTPE